VLLSITNQSGFQFRQCLEFLDEMTEMGIPKNVIIFGAAMSCMEKCSRADIGFQLMKRMKEEGIAPNVHIYNSAISACARSNLWEKGHELYEEMEREGVKRDVVTFNAGKPHLGDVCNRICWYISHFHYLSKISIGCSVFANSTWKAVV
jgi:pentatricopeptide repeat protein